MTPSDPTPASSSPDLAAALAADEYLVQAGDTLVAIAKRFGVELIDLMNHNAIGDARTLNAGQRLRIPGLVTVPTTLTDTPPPPIALPTEASTPAAPAAPINGAIYVVREKDTMNSIAQRFNSTVPALLVANNMPGEDAMYVGQRMIIPKPSLVLRVAEAEAAAPRASDVGVLGVGDASTPVVSPQEIQAYLAGKRTTFYVTHAGDTITGVANLFQVDSLILSQLNQVRINDTLSPGTRLIIPLK